MAMMLEDALKRVQIEIALNFNLDIEFYDALKVLVEYVRDQQNFVKDETTLKIDETHRMVKQILEHTKYGQARKGTSGYG